LKVISVLCCVQLTCDVLAIAKFFVVFAARLDLSSVYLRQ